MSATRRNLLCLGGGAAAGVVFTPVPWKLLDDVSIWTQNWSWLPVPPRGEITRRYTVCTMCGAGCGVEARCVNGQPFGLVGVANHPVSRGALCPAGFGAHQLPYHPLRVKGAPVEPAVKAAAEGADAGMAILDERPGRASSMIYRQFAAQTKGGVYAVPSAPAAGADLENMKTAISFGVPLLEGWGVPGRVLAEWSRGLRLIQVEARHSRGAAMAQRWVMVKPCRETAAAEALCGALEGDRGRLEAAAGRAGVPVSEIEAVAADLKENGPAAAFGEGPAVLELNRLLGSLGARGGLTAAPEVPGADAKAAPVTVWADIPDGSLRLLIADGMGLLPWVEVKRKLAADAVVVGLSAYRAGYAEHAQFVVAAPSFGEGWDDAGAPEGAAAASWTVAAPLTPAPEGVIAPAEFVARVAAARGRECPALEDALKARAAAIHKRGRGTVFSFAAGETAAVKDLSGDDLWTKMQEGAVWVDEAPAPAKPSFSPREAPAAVEGALIAMVAGWRGLLPPLATKLTQESKLWRGERHAGLSPRTAASLGVKDGAPVDVETAYGKARLAARVDLNVPDGVVELAAAGAGSQLCPAAGHAAVKVRRA